MRHLFAILVVLVLCTAVAAGVRKPDEDPGRKVVAKASAALFVGVREFPDDDSLAPVPYAVDDAVDLAYEFTLDHQPPLVEVQRVVLALSGEPQKSRSREKLNALLAAGARRERAGQSNILKLLKSQSNAVGKDGILIISFATHGRSVDGTQYLLIATSLLDDLETTLTDAKIRDVVGRSSVQRSLILLDACRERLTRDRRAGDADPRAVAAFMHELAGTKGQAVLSAAAAGDYAYDDPARGNGVFTGAVIDGLHCGAGMDPHGYVTVDTLHAYVLRHVLSWVREHKDPRAQKVTQLLYEGESQRMPLAICVSDTASASPHRPR
jgi:hypothetical protein